MSQLLSVLEIFAKIVGDFISVSQDVLQSSFRVLSLLIVKFITLYFCNPSRKVHPLVRGGQLQKSELYQVKAFIVDLQQEALKSTPLFHTLDWKAPQIVKNEKFFHHSICVSPSWLK